MYTSRKSSRSALSRIHQAIQAGFAYGWTEGGDNGGGGGAPPKAPEKKDETPSFTEAQLNAAIEKALADQKKRDEAAAARKKEEDDRKAAEAQGEFKKLADSEKSRADAAEAKAKELTRSIALRDHLADKHPEYATCAKYILPLIPADAEGDELAKAVEKASADYVKDNPRTSKASGAPAPMPSTANRGFTGANRSPRTTPRPVSVAASRF